MNQCPGRTTIVTVGRHLSDDALRLSCDLPASEHMAVEHWLNQEIYGMSAEPLLNGGDGTVVIFSLTK